MSLPLPDHGQAAASFLLQPVRIRLNGVDMSQGLRDSLLNDPQDRVGRDRQPVMNPQAIPASVDQTRPAKVCEMPGGFGLRDAQTLMNVTDANLSREEQPENP
jgi:hypothetical protein